MSDEDMKIAGKPEQNNKDSFEESFLKQRENGNVAKAHKLGVDLADNVIISEQRVHDFTDTVNFHSYVRQKRLLLAFVIHASLNLYCKNSILTETAKADFDTTVEKKSPVTDRDINEGTAFTLYYLAKRSNREKDIPAAIGKTFAELCGVKGNKVFINLGKELFLEFEEITKKAVENADFV